MANQVERAAARVEYVRVQQSSIAIERRWLGLSQHHPLADLPQR